MFHIYTMSVISVMIIVIVAILITSGSYLIFNQHQSTVDMGTLDINLSISSTLACRIDASVSSHNLNFTISSNLNTSYHRTIAINVFGSSGCGYAGSLNVLLPVGIYTLKSETNYPSTMPYGKLENITIRQNETTKLNISLIGP